MKKKKSCYTMASLPLKCYLQYQVILSCPFPCTSVVSVTGCQYRTQYFVFPTQSRNCAVFDMSSMKTQRISIPLGQRKSMPFKSILEYEDQ